MKNIKTRPAFFTRPPPLALVSTPLPPPPRVPAARVPPTERVVGSLFIYFFLIFGELPKEADARGAGILFNKSGPGFYFDASLMTASICC